MSTWELAPLDTRQVTTPISDFFRIAFGPAVFGMYFFLYFSLLFNLIKF